MPWVRVGDNASSYPKLLAIAGLPGAPASAVHEVGWFFLSCATASAAHVTDYVVNTGTVMAAGGPRWKRLLDWSVRVGLLTPAEDDEGLPMWVLLNDPKFVHLRTQAELDAEERKRDVAKRPHLAIEVRHRDGDNCRYCGIYVIWDGRKSGRSGELDHRDPDEHATTADDLVVACRSCNGSRQDNRHDWDAGNPLRPVPTRPNYGEPTASWLTANGRPTDPNVDHDVLRARGKVSSSSAATRRDRAARPTQQQPTAPTPTSEAAAPADAPQPAHAAGAAPAWAGDPTPAEAEPPPKSAPNGDRGSIGTGSAGSGREGSARAGTGRRRGSRGGKRRKPRPPGAPEHQQAQAGERP